MKRNLLLIITIITLLLSACNTAGTDVTSVNGASAVLAQEAQPTATSTTSDSGEDDGVARPDGWSEATHAKSADPNYDVVFPQDEVNRIDIVIEPENWQAMLDDMASLYGEPGTRTGEMGDRPMRPGGNAPQERPAPPADDAPRERPAAPAGQAPPAAQGDRPMGGPQGGMPPEGGMPLEGGENPIYVPVTVAFEDDTWANVGLRFKGNSSLRSTWNSGNMKLPLRLDFDQFEDAYPEIDDQRFYGFEQLTFASNFNDASFLREKVTADIFREASVPAAQTAFYEVYIDYGDGPVYFGLYTAVEVVDDTVIETQFDDDDGNVAGDGNAYKPSGNGATFAEGTFSEASFDKQTNASEEDWSDIQALFDALHADTRASDPAAWRAGLEAVFDVDGFLNWLAVNTVVQNWDTYGTMSHNYYLYHDPTTDQIVWIPWDNNEALSSGKRGNLSLSLNEVGNNWPLIRYLLDDKVYYAQYVAYVDAVINTAFDPEKMETTYNELAEMIEPYVLAENAEHTFLRSGANFYAAIEALVEHAYARYDAAVEFVAGQ
ncbi:MAG: CotH kinase family protein [Anaerolineae bacterium]|nr:CotH kinase family protein [Anaerolineae bacterium]